MNEKLVKEASEATSDPQRAKNNLLSFAAENPSFSDRLEAALRPAAVLFGSSQFLANHCIAYPEAFFESLGESDKFPDREALAALLTKALEDAGAPDRAMTVVRRFRLRHMLTITLRDLLKKADIVDTFMELSCLADVIIGASVELIRNSVRENFGAPDEDLFCVIGLGKHGAEELNYSSDVDLMYVYGSEAGETSGVSTGAGIRKNRIGCHEYYCKIGEALTKFLSAHTEAGFAYRVDLRLRPEGARGDIALALRGFEMYYESWGRAWERAMLLRARPVAGDAALGRSFMESIRPFVYRKYLDYGAIDEIRGLKSRIDSTFKKGDIKRGFGGIREIEFFVQALQLIYGGREPLLRERSTLRALHMLLQKSIIGQEDAFILSDNYRYLRTLEHRLQQLGDLQTHTLPAGIEEVGILGKKMGFASGKIFMSNLEARRSAVRNIYNSLLAAKEESAASATFMDEDLSDSELKEYLKEAGLKDPEKAARNVRALKEGVFHFQTLRGRRLLGSIIPELAEAAIGSSDPDAALNRLQSFASLLGANESYLEIFQRDKGLIKTLAYVFSQSEYLSKSISARPQYLEMLGWSSSLKKSLRNLRDDLQSAVSQGRTPADAIRLVRQAEEIRLGMLFLQKKLGMRDVVKELSKTAEAVLSFCSSACGMDGESLCVIGFGKLGGREITFNSDLDVIFASGSQASGEGTKAAERLLRMLISYTREGTAYKVDTRLRPDGSKGPLVSSVESFESYYSKAAAFWEFQALLKARPVAGDRRTSGAFMHMAKKALMERGREISASDILKMRARILRELVKEKDGFDVKLGPGGLEEIEFMIQYLQLKHCWMKPELLVQGTADAAARLGRAEIIPREETVFLLDAYWFYRTIESFLRLRGEPLLGKQGAELANVAAFTGYAGAEEFSTAFTAARERVSALFAGYVAD